MKFSAKKEELVKALAVVLPVVGNAEIMSHILLTVGEGGKPKIQATNIENSVETPVMLDKGDTGKVCIPAKKLYEIVREMEGTVAVTCDDSNATIKCGKSIFKLKCQKAEDFPQPVSVENAFSVSMGVDEIADMIGRTITAAGEPVTKVLNSLLFHFKAKEENKTGVLFVVGTDGHRLMLTGKAVEVNEDRKFIVPKRALEFVKGLLSGEDKMELTFDARFARFHLPNGTCFTTNLMEGTYPSYDQVLPKDCTTTVEINREDLIKALRRVSIISKGRVVTLELKTNSMQLSSVEKDLGDSKDEIAAQYEGEAFKAIFNMRYILDALSVMHAEKARLLFNVKGGTEGPILTPMLIREDGRPDFGCVAMPMRQ